MKMEDIKAYQDELATRVNNERTITDENGRSAVIKLRVPSIRDAINVGTVWVNSISSGVIEALGVDSSYDARNKYMSDLAAATNSRQHLHWVESITFNGATVSKAETLEKIFDTVISSNDTLRESFMKHVQDFSNETLMSVIGIPNYTCPACGGHQHMVEGEQEGAEIPTIIPIEAATTFFDLLFQRTELIRQRG